MSGGGGTLNALKRGHYTQGQAGVNLEFGKKKNDWNEQLVITVIAHKPEVVDDYSFRSFCDFGTLSPLKK